MVPPYTNTAGMFMRAMAISAPGMFLSHPPTASTPSTHWALHTVSIESAITSRETREYFIPSVPMEMPSLTVIVPKVWGMPPAARTGLGAQRQVVELGVAGRDRAVRVRDADDRLREVLIAEPDGAQHRTVGRALNAGGDRPAPEGAHRLIARSTSSRCGSISIGRLACRGAGSRS